MGKAGPTQEMGNSIAIDGNASHSTEFYRFFVSYVRIQFAKLHTWNDAMNKVRAPSARRWKLKTDEKDDEAAENQYTDSFVALLPFHRLSFSSNINEYQHSLWQIINYAQKRHFHYDTSNLFQSETVHISTNSRRTSCSTNAPDSDSADDVCFVLLALLLRCAFIHISNPSGDKQPTNGRSTKQTHEKRWYETKLNKNT